jgi:hypothetical protein
MAVRNVSRQAEVQDVGRDATPGSYSLTLMDSKRHLFASDEGVIDQAVDA